LDGCFIECNVLDFFFSVFTEDPEVLVGLVSDVLERVGRGSYKRFKDLVKGFDKGEL